MNHRQPRAARAGMGLVSLATAGIVLANAVTASAVDFAHPAFKRVWDRTDSLVASGQVSRTFFWGPEPRAAAQEQYVDSPTGTGTRLVQYFDKSRMEINDPNGNQNSPFYVTNGLLTIELISGQMQIGNNAFVNRFAANIPISGDTDDVQAPTYVSFGAVSNTRIGDHPQPDRTKMAAPQNVTATINKAGQVGNDQTRAALPGTKVVYWEPATKHNIPDVFWQFLNATGPISETGQIVNKRLIDPWFYASGFPISDAYWSRVKIKGEMQDVMIQAYERRVLTYVPTNVPGFQVEMGNIGLHYYDWRYKDAGRPTGTPATATRAVATAVGSGTAVVATATSTPGTPAPTMTGTPPTATPSLTPTPNVITQGVISFASDRSGNRDIWRVNADGTNPVNLTGTSTKLDDFPAYSPDRTKIAFTSERDNNLEIYVMNADGSGITRLTNDAQEDFAPTWSPDGTKIAFVSKRNGGQEDIFVMNSNGTGQTNITLVPGPDTDPSWGSNGKIVFTSRRSGTRQLYTVNPDGTQLTGPISSGGENFLAKWNNVGNRLVFVSTRDGNQEIYISGSGGQEPTRLTNNTFPDWDPAFAPDGSRIVFSSDRLAGNLELYVMNSDGSNQERITIQTGADVHPSWSIR
ncbi:MAG TPA: DPP IV N-terminal domain-containing protein [Chloroflexia bacterium]|nr:DPP IV N-terminal domain-containing protein [Chloroflexia bacterium]